MPMVLGKSKRGFKPAHRCSTVQPINDPKLSPKMIERPNMENEYQHCISVCTSYQSIKAITHYYANIDLSERQ